MEKFARDRELAPGRAERTDTLVWGKNAVTELLKSGGAVDTVYLTDTMPQAVAGYYTALSKESGAVVKQIAEDVRHAGPPGRGCPRSRGRVREPGRSVQGRRRER
jgi:tRNA G18 (ribose-2'-O)-methylase SpoU